MSAPDAAEQSVPEAADFDVFALRSFRYSVEPQRDNETVGETIGWWTDGQVRVWRSISYNFGDAWVDGTCEAVCHARRPNKPAHPAPHEGCGCGIYGSLSYADLIQQFPSESSRLVTVIAAEGNTIIGSRGLRTQFARIVAYWVTPTHPEGNVNAPAFREIAALQFKDAQVFDCPMEMIETYGLALLPLPTRLRSRGYWA